MHAGVGNSPTAFEAEDLIAAAVGEEGAIPSDEAVQSPLAGDQVLAGPEVQMIGVAQDDSCAGLHQMRMGQRLDGALRADRHEDRGLDDAMGRGQPPRAGAAIGRNKIEPKGHD